MTYGRLDEAQLRVLQPIVRGRVVHDLGAGDYVLAEVLMDLGAAAVVAVDCAAYAFWPVRPGIATVQEYFSTYAATEPAIDVAFVSWPYNQVEPGLFALVARARTVAYLGKCTDGVVCGFPGLFRHFLGRALVAHAPHPANTLLVYGQSLAAPRTGELEERAGLDWQTVRMYTRAVVKACACGREFSADEWRALRFVGTMDDGEGGELELRNCPCRSTLSMSAGP